MEVSKKPIILAWSGGKDSSLALWRLLNHPEYEVRYLLTTLSDRFKRISMHGVREELLDAQSEELGIPLLKVWIYESSYEEYERRMEEVLLRAKAEGIDTVAFGDIFLEDLRTYREDNVAKVNMKAIFPLWKEPTAALARQFIDQQFKTILCCTNDAWLGEDIVGMEYSDELLRILPENVDPCGENGEFHTFCFDGPIFKNPILLQVGEKLFKPLELPESADECGTEEVIKTTGFWYVDLIKPSVS